MEITSPSTNRSSFTLHNPSAAQSSRANRVNSRAFPDPIAQRDRSGLASVRNGNSVERAEFENPDADFCAAVCQRDFAMVRLNC